MWESLLRDWRVIADAPLASGLYAIAVILGVWVVLHFLFKHRFDDQESTIKNKQSEIDLHKATVSGLKTEIEKLNKEVTKPQATAGPAALLPVTHGNTAIQTMYTDLTRTKTVRLTLPTHPTDSNKWKPVVFTLSGEEFETLAAARRLVESGLANVEEPAPGRYTLTASSVASNLRSAFDEYIKTKKKD